jgi:hypothetical protein
MPFLLREKGGRPTFMNRPPFPWLSVMVMVMGMDEP